MAAPTTTFDAMTDEVLLNACHAGDEQAFEQLFLRHYPRVYRVALRVVGNHEDAEEVAMDTFSQLYQQKLDPDRGSNVSGWLYRTSTNAAFNVVRGRKRRQSWWQRLIGRDAFVNAVEDPVFHILRNESNEHVRRSLAGVPERQRNAVVLRASGLSYSEIASAIGVQTSSVGTLIARGERKLREVMMSESEAT